MLQQEQAGVLGAARNSQHRDEASLHTQAAEPGQILSQDPGAPPFKKSEGPQSRFAHDSVPSVRENEIILAVAVVCFSDCLSELLQNRSPSPLAGLQSQEQSSGVAWSKSTFMTLISALLQASHNHSKALFSSPWKCLD